MIAFYLPGGIPVYLYALLMGISSVIGLVWIANRAPAKTRTQTMEAGLYALLGALVGSRAGYVILNWKYFHEHMIEVLQVNLGGLTWSGAILTSLIALLIYSRLKHILFAPLSDSVLPMYATFFVIGWLACIFEGCAYGAVNESWWALPVRDEFGVITKRFPLQLIGALFGLAWFWLIEKWIETSQNNAWIKASGRASLIVLGGFIFEILCLSFLRADLSPTWHGLRLDIWISVCFLLILMCVMLVMLIIQFGKSKRNHENSYVGKRT